MNKKKKYYVGFDIGTNSVGWAVTDDEYNIKKFNGKRMWGVRLFDEAETAVERRTNRSNRRRLERRKSRIALLQDLFSEEINKVDPGFYKRLEESKFWIEDKTIKEKHTLFIGDSFNDKDFYSKYPTIYHLRADLIKDKSKKDIRLIYLAIHHIIKNRGHFLFEGDTFDTASSIDESIKNLFADRDIITDEFEMNYQVLEEIKNILLDNKQTKSDKKRKIKVLVNKSKQLESIFGLAVGTKESLSALFDDEEYKNLENDVIKISFSEKIYEEERDKYESVLNEKIILLDNIKKIYDSVILSSIKKDNMSLSESKVEIYNKHKEELKVLKKLIKENLPKEYKSFFSDDSEKNNNYKNYIGDGQKKINREDFYKEVKKLVSKIDDCIEKEYILSEINLDNYLPLLRVKENGVIPYQINQSELIEILENALNHYEFLNKEKDGLSVVEKIIKIMTFRIPYYVGPLNTYHSGKENGFAWAIRREGKENEKIFPWNINEIIDMEKSHEEFIKRMTNKCTYLIGEDVLPKNSLLYSEYSLLNELNNIRCNGQLLSVEIRNNIIEKIYKNEYKKGKVTVKKIHEFLNKEGYCDKDALISGIDQEVKSDIKSYRDFMNILEDKFDYDMVEDIIQWITLYAEDRNSIKKRIKDNYGNILNKEEIDRIIRLKYKDWGRFSRKLLTEVIDDQLTDYSTGEMGSLISAMRNSNNNFMKLMSNNYNYLKKIEEINREKFQINEKISHEMLDDLYVSPSVKRMIWQSILIMEEIKKIMGCEPEKIFIETIRSNQAVKKATDSRKKRLLELYNNCKDETRNWKSEIENQTDGQLRGKKLYLYYLQMGRCMYTNEIIDLGKLMSGEEYDIDHIYPRSKTKDDSFDNLVLVKRSVNNEKSDTYPISNTIQGKMSSTWKGLYSKGFISHKKYERLVRKEEFSVNELSGFIARQLVETSQSTKAVAQIMNRMYKDSNIVYVKGENVSAFRKQRDFIKVREINDLHHGKDAYLNIVVGNVFDTKFTAIPSNFVKEAGFREYNLNRMFDFAVQRKDYVAWDGENGNSFKIVKKTMDKNDLIITRKQTQGKGKLFDLTVYKNEICKEEGYIGVKSSDERLADVKKYGGFTKLKIAYMLPYICKVKTKKGDNREIKRICPVPILVDNKFKDNNDMEKYVLSQVPIKKGEIIEELKIHNAKLKVGTLIKYNGFKYYVGGRSGESFCSDSGMQLILGINEEKYIKELVKYRNALNTNKEIKAEEFSSKITKDNNIGLYNVLIDKMNASIYRKATNNKYEMLNDEKVREKFESLTVENEIDMLFELLNLLTNKKSTYDMKILCQNSGRRKLGFNLDNVEEFKVINQSVTGLFENITDIMVQS